MSPEKHIFNKLPGDANAAGAWTPLWVAKLYSILPTLVHLSISNEFCLGTWSLKGKFRGSPTHCTWAHHSDLASAHLTEVVTEAALTPALFLRPLRTNSQIFLNPNAGERPSGSKKPWLLGFDLPQPHAVMLFKSSFTCSNVYSVSIKVMVWFIF